MSVNTQAIQPESVRPSPLSTLVNATQTKSKQAPVAASGSFATVLNESRLQMRAKLQQRENTSPQQMFEKDDQIEASGRPSIPQNENRLSANNATGENAASPAQKPHSGDSLHQDLSQQLQPRTSASNATQSGTVDPASSSSNFAGNGSDSPFAEFGAFDKVQARRDVSSQRTIENAPDDARRLSLDGASSNTAPLISVTQPGPTSANVSNTANLAEDLGQWLKSQLKHEISGMSSDKLIITSPTRSSASAFGETAKSFAPESQQSNPNVDDEPEVESPSQVLFNQLVRSMRVRHDSKSSSAQIELDPPRLGPMRVDIKMEGNQLRMEIQTTSNEAKELVTSKLADLKAALLTQGVKLDDVNVLVAKTITPISESIASQNQSPRTHDQLRQTTNDRTDTRKSTKRGDRQSGDSLLDMTRGLTNASA